MLEMTVDSVFVFEVEDSFEPQEDLRDVPQGQ